MSFNKKNNWLNSPRINSLSEIFENIASGNKGKPLKKNVIPIEELFNNEFELRTFYNQYCKFKGPFANHFLASIPYMLEEECRIGNGILNYLKELSYKEKRVTTLQTIGTAEAVSARTIVSLSEGKIHSLSNSPTSSNFDFFKLNQPKNCSFHLGPFFDLDNNFLSKKEYSEHFSQGMDIIFEDTTFQMYDSNRKEQIGFILQNLSANGILFCLEKCLQEDTMVYEARERQKDLDFKSKYFGKKQIKDKGSILKEMIKGQVTFKNLKESINHHLPFVDLLWNSGNFYLIAASNKRENLDNFKSKIPNPIIPKEFQYEKPKILH